MFTVRFYIPYFLTANIRADAAVDDLILFKKLKKVPAGDKLLADEALTTLSHHLWFLAPNNTLISLAGKKLEDRMMKSAALQTSCICQNQI